MSITISDINEVNRTLGQKPTKTSMVVITTSLNAPVLRSYIYRELTKSFAMAEREIAVEWFIALYRYEAFDVKNIPGPIKIRDRNGIESVGFRVWEAYFLIWEAAKYNAEYQNLNWIILELIDGYIQFTKEHKDDPERNFACDYYFCQYIFLVSEQSFKEQYLGFVVETGLSHDNSLISSDITERFFYKALRWQDTRHDIQAAWTYSSGFPIRVRLVGLKSTLSLTISIWNNSSKEFLESYMGN